MVLPPTFFLFFEGTVASRLRSGLKDSKIQFKSQPFHLLDSQRSKWAEAYKAFLLCGPHYMVNNY